MRLLFSEMILDMIKQQDRSLSGQNVILIKKIRRIDKNGKITASYEELKEYITNVYYVLMTRGIKGTYLYVCDDELREYFSKYIEEEN